MAQDVSRIVISCSASREISMPLWNPRDSSRY